METIKGSRPKTLQEKFTEVRLLLTEIEDQMEKDYQRFIDLQQLKFEFNEHEKFNKES